MEEDGEKIAMMTMKLGEKQKKTVEGDGGWEWGGGGAKRWQKRRRRKGRRVEGGGG